MLKEKMEKALNEQINKELYSSYLYLSMSAYAQTLGLPGVANWMKIQAKEELTHANKFFDYVHERNARVLLQPIAGVDTEFGTVINLFERVLEHEQMVTESINKLMDISIELSDHATRSMLHWFVDEQVEEEANVQEIIDNLKMVEGKGQGLFMIDKDLGARVFVDETQNA
ncbi:ferritin [Roseimarinus sediminis]|uniref:ferritin n=1 Tax=Roseimarinus sediminis TaxID=1610899 RepID=UPI003D1E29BD